MARISEIRASIEGLGRLLEGVAARAPELAGAPATRGGWG